MRRLVLVASVLSLPGCALSDFFSDTHTYGTNPNRPIADSETVRRVEGEQFSSQPLTPEPGNVWPTKREALPTLEDLEKQTSSANASQRGDNLPVPEHRQQRPARALGSSSPPSPPGPGLPPFPAPNVPSVSARPPEGSQLGKPVQLPGGGTGVTSGGNSNYQTFTSPSGPGVVIPNGNGTSTVIKPDGTISTIPTPR